MLPVSLNSQFWVALTVYSNIYLWVSEQYLIRTMCCSWNNEVSDRKMTEYWFKIPNVTIKINLKSWRCCRLARSCTSWIYACLCNENVSPINVLSGLNSVARYHQFCQLISASQWLSPLILLFFHQWNDRHDITQSIVESGYKTQTTVILKHLTNLPPCRVSVFSVDWHMFSVHVR